MNHDPFTVSVLLGTGRMSTPPHAPHPVLEAAWGELDWSARESAMLAAMALAGSARSAGAVPVAAEADAAGDVAGEEMLPACGASAALCLRRMLAGEHAEFLPEWLAEAARLGRRAAFRDLPGLLKMAARERALRPAVAAVLGARGTWLARRTEGWGEVLEASLENIADEAWETGSIAERAAWLRQARAVDPERAAQALAKAWGEAAREERERLLAVVADAPTAHDEALLEGEALRDRRREVRSLARAALLRRPGSAFAARARERAESMVALEGLLLGRRLVLRPPEAFEAGWKADGIEEKPPAGTGARAHWARQWLGCVPISTWTRRFDLKAEKLFALNRDDEWREVILLGWIDAAMAAPERENAESFALHLVGLEKWPKGAPVPLAVFSHLIDALEPDAAARVLAAADAGAGKAAENSLYFELLFRSGFALPEKDATRALDRAVEALQAKPYPQLQSNHARSLARRLPLAVAGDSLRRLAALPELSGPTEELLRAIEFRHQLHHAFTTSP